MEWEAIAEITGVEGILLKLIGVGGMINGGGDEGAGEALGQGVSNLICVEVRFAAGMLVAFVDDDDGTFKGVWEAFGSFSSLYEATSSLSCLL